MKKAHKRKANLNCEPMAGAWAGGGGALKTLRATPETPPSRRMLVLLWSQFTLNPGPNPGVEFPLSAFSLTLIGQTLRFSADQLVGTLCEKGWSPWPEL